MPYTQSKASKVLPTAPTSFANTASSLIPPIRSTSSSSSSVVIVVVFPNALASSIKNTARSNLVSYVRTRSLFISFTRSVTSRNIAYPICGSHSSLSRFDFFISLIESTADRNFASASFTLSSASRALSTARAGGSGRRSNASLSFLSLSSRRICISLASSLSCTFLACFDDAFRLATTTSASSAVSSIAFLLPLLLLLLSSKRTPSSLRLCRNNTRVVDDVNAHDDATMIEIDR